MLHVIIGLGDTGLSCARYLARCQIPFAVMDTRSNPPGLADYQAQFPHQQCVLGKLDAGLLQQAEVIVLSPGVSLKEPLIAHAVAEGKQVVGDVELFARAVKKPIAAITGTNAKSTVTTLVGQMMQVSHQAAVGGNIGVPVLDLFLQSTDVDAYILELSSFQLETTRSLHARVACMLNVSEDHMDRYAELSDYVAAKKRIYDGATCVVFNRDDPLTYPTESPAMTYSFTLGAPNENEFGILSHQGADYLAFGSQPLLAVTALPIIGKHYQANALASLAIGYGMGLPFEDMLSVLKTFQGLPHRCQLIREHHGIKWFNDSKGTNVGATVAAIQGLGAELNKQLILIAGGVGKEADFSPLAPFIARHVRHTILFGQDAKHIAKVIADQGAVSYASDMADAISQANHLSQPGDCVLLSPACASFDMFRHYAHRGDVFTAIVNQLP